MGKGPASFAGMKNLRVSWRYILAALLLVVLMAVSGLPSWVWAQASAVPTRNVAISVAVAPGQPNVVLAGTLNAPESVNVFRSTDGAVGWVGLTNGLRPNISAAGIAFDPQNPNLILIGDGGFGYMFRSQDGGTTWEELAGFRELLSENSAVGELYAAVQDGVTVFFACTRFDGVLRSPNAGNIWQKLDAGLEGEARRVREVALYGNDLYAGTHAGLYRLRASASVWEPVPGIPAGNIVFSLLTDGDTLYAGTGIGLFRSPDGNTWEQVPNFPSTIVYDMASTGRLLVAATENGLWTGAGDSWQQATINGVPYGGVAYAIANIPQAPRTLYAATATDWILRSDDEGVTFYLPANMPPLDVQAALATATPTFTPSPTPTDTPTPTATATETPTPTPTFTPSPTPTETPLPTDTPTATEAPLDVPPTPSIESSAPLTGTGILTIPVPLTATAPISIPLPLPGESPAAPESTPAQVAPGQAITEGVTLPEVPLPTPTAAPQEASTASPTATDTPSPVPTATPTATATETPTVTPTATPTVTPTATPTRVPIDVVATIYASLPPVFVGAGLLLALVVLAAGFSIIRGPRDI
ncbi:MAG: hypothetical protein KatS3mg050_1517 [Litorilinea sp.]|nr:MAG: hypothetical protein KatS3mg050_1517 [Litorilinea sp.]